MIAEKLSGLLSDYDYWNIRILFNWSVILYFPLIWHRGTTEVSHFKPPAVTSPHPSSSQCFVMHPHVSFWGARSPSMHWSYAAPTVHVHIASWEPVALISKDDWSMKWAQIYTRQPSQVRECVVKSKYISSLAALFAENRPEGCKTKAESWDTLLY